MEDIELASGRSKNAVKHPPISDANPNKNIFSINLVMHFFTSPFLILNL